MSALRLTEGELQAIRVRQRGWAKVAPAASVAAPKQFANLIPGGHTVKSKKAKPKGMNKWEEAFSHVLEHKRLAKELSWWAFEPFRIRLADGCFYRPDFVSVDMDGRTAIYEVKGHFRESARVRLRVAAEKLPYPFYLVKKTGKELKVHPI